MITRLNKLGICLSHSKTTQIIKGLGEGYQNEVLQWKSLMEDEVPAVQDSPCSLITCSSDESENSSNAASESSDPMVEILSSSSSES